MITQRHETDVLVIGGSAGGLYAAITAHEQGVKTMIVSKALLGRGGCSATFGYLGATYKPGDKDARLVQLDSTQDKSFPDKIKYYGHFLVDQEFAKKAWSYTNRFFNRMEEFGLYIRRTDDGTLVTAGDFGYGPVSPKHGNSGKGVIDVLRGQVFRHGIPVLEESMGVSLIESNGRVGGALVYDYMRGVIHEVRAKTVILACGHVNWLWNRSTATREQAGNGLAMAFHAGAELAGIEMIWWHIADMARPAAWMRSHMYPNPMPMTTETIEYYNSAGELFFRSNMYKAAQPSYYLQCKHLMKEINKGLARTDGGYYAFFGNVDANLLDEYCLGHTFMRKLGLDPRKDLIECAMTCHQQRGGVAMDHSMATRVEGLYVAGSMAADFITGIVTVCWEAETAALSAVNYARTHEHMTASEPAKALENRLNGYLAAAPSNPLTPSAIKHEIRQLMGREMDYIKNGEKIQRAIDGLRAIRREMLPRMRIPSKSRVANYDLMDALDLPDMLDVAELICVSALNRKESRAAFYRTDYPTVDNRNWLKNIYLSGTLADVKVRLGDVDLKYVRPVDDTADFLESEY
jgi:succinate dehydrogenase/fumarate reductase flavoprotein subunit